MMIVNAQMRSFSENTKKFHSKLIEEFAL